MFAGAKGDFRRGGRRVALVIGNADYQAVGDLPNASIDAVSISDTLRQLGFDVIFRLDQSREELVHAVSEFEGELSSTGTCDLALLYYAGHGVQLNGENFIVPIDYDASADKHVRNLFSVQTILEIMARTARKSLLFLDACRDRGGIDPRLIDEEGNAKAEFGGGLGKIELTQYEHTFVAYAADPGDVAEDGPYGFGSPFSNAIARHLPTRSVDIHEILQWVANDVRRSTGGRQRPWAYSNMTAQLHLTPKSWQPFWTLIGLGALTGAINAWLSYDPATRSPFDVSQQPWLLLSTLLFGAVLGYGVWKWGRRTLWAALLAVVIYALIASYARYQMARSMGDCRTDPTCFAERIRGFTDWDALMATAEMREMILVVILVGALIGLASVVSGAVTSRALRPLSRISVGILFGAFSAALYLAFLAARTNLPAWASDFEMAAIYFNSALWQAGLAGNVGWAYTHYIERPSA